MNIMIGLLALLSHWRRHPLQLATLIVGLALATGLWTGVQALNTEARTSYAKAESLLAPSQFKTILPRRTSGISQETFVALQRTSWNTSPVFEAQARLAGRSIGLIGIDVLTNPVALLENSETTGQLRNDLPALFGYGGLAFASSTTASMLGNHRDLGPIEASEAIPPDTVIADLSAIARFLPNGAADLEAAGFSRLVVIESGVDVPLENISDNLVMAGDNQRADTGQIADSFHLNLTAFGLLSFVVGLLVVYGTISLSFEQRRNVFQTLRTLGMSRIGLLNSLLFELFILALIGGTTGILLGYLLATLLLPDVAATLRSLYGASVEGELSLRPEWWVSGLLMALFGTLLAAANSLWKLYRLPLLQSSRLRATFEQAERLLKWQLLAGFVTLLAGVAAIYLSEGLFSGFVILGALLIGSALVLPTLLSLVLKGLSTLAKGPRAEWFMADTRLLLPALSVALMALLLAAATNVGVSTMVGSFRSTFTDWLDQRLAAEIYFRGRSDEEATMIVDWLKERSDAVLPVRSAESTLNRQKGKIAAMADHATFRETWQLKDRTPEAWNDLAAGEAILVNEQLSLRQNKGVGDPVSLGIGSSLPIAGIYSDYGNPAIEAIVSVELFDQWFPDAPKQRYVVRVPDDRVETLIRQIRDEFDLPGEFITDQKSAKALSMRIFERTFLVTDALNLFTLLIAGFAILTSLMTLSAFRLPQLAPAWALGMTRQQLAMTELLRSSGLALLTGLLAIPVGLGLGWILINIINVEAFGWRLPFEFQLFDLFKLLLFALSAAVFATLYPALRLTRLPPHRLLQVFSTAR